MPRRASIDAAGALQHIICRWIQRCRIYQDDSDRQDFLSRLGHILRETRTPCYAWALMPNHFHLLLRTGDAPISIVMKRVLTGYAVRFNRRHRRSGHLFQNSYKSIPFRSVLCYWAVKQLGMSGAQVARWLGIGQPAVQRSVLRGDKIVRELNLVLSP
jgi:REP element-mobilizing transposase RayT